MVARRLSFMFEMSWLSGEVPRSTTPIFREEREEEVGRMGEPHLCTWEDHRADPCGRDVKAHEG